MRPLFRLTASISCAFFLIVQPLSAFDTPLSDTAVRDAYFVGQRRDDSLAELVLKYGHTLPPPATGPYIQSISFLTPYVLTAINSSQHVGIYSAQQAQLDHDKGPESVRIVVQIWLTESYGQFMARPAGSDSHSQMGVALRPANFWRDFRLRVFQNEQLLIPTNATGEPTFRCTEDACDLTGATITFEYPAAAFTEETASILVTPPEGDPVSVGFDLTSFR